MAGTPFPPSLTALYTDLPELYAPQLDGGSKVDNPFMRCKGPLSPFCNCLR